MTKGPAFDFLGLYSAILKDVQSEFPLDSREWSRDFKSLSALSRTRGLGLFTLDLPSLDRALLRGLETGRLDVFNLPLARRRSNTDRVPRLFWGLWSRLFDEDCRLRADFDVNVLFFLRTLLCTGKTLKVDSAPKYLFKATKELFDVDAILPVPSGFWNSSSDPSNLDVSICREERDQDLGDTAGPSLVGDAVSVRELDDMLSSVQFCADRTSGLLGSYDPGMYRFRHGPGAVSDLKGGSFKYDFPGWSEMLDTFFSWDEWGTTPLGFMEELSSRGYTIDSKESPSRLIAVPKTRKGPRLIAAEPTANQWCQQNVRDFLYTRVDATLLGKSIDFRRQDLSQHAVLVSSLSKRMATLDLSSASDRVSCWLVERMFRRNPNLLSAMRASRTRVLSNLIDKKYPAELALRKFSTMGSALTFPVQSLVFLNICLGVGRYLLPKASWEQLHRQVRIFGDDIIIPVEWEPSVVRVLEALFLKVNHNKSFRSGYFRESCGMDAYKGYDVTPARIGLSDRESVARLMASRVAVSNNFFQKGLWNAAAWLAQTAGPSGVIQVVHRESGVFGLHTNCRTGYDFTRRKTRWNRDLHQFEILVTQAIARVKRVKPNTPGRLLQYFTEEPPPHIDWEGGLTTGCSVSLRRSWVPLGLLGYIPSWSRLGGSPVI